MEIKKTIFVATLLLWATTAMAQFNSNWANAIGVDNFPDEGNSVKCDATGNVYIAGDFAGINVDFGGAHLNSSHGAQDIFFAKYNSNGVCQWAHGIGGGTDDDG